jgi:hypothetical protein
MTDSPLPPAGSRREFLARAGALAGLAAAGPLLGPARLTAAGRSNARPRPIPGSGFPPFHIFDPAPGKEQSAITDFTGLVGSVHLQGTGLANDRPDRLSWDADVRFMDGVYRGVDGRLRRQTFGFV